MYFSVKPIINGTGNYYIEAQTRDQKRTDIIIDYLDYFGLSTGYMLSFNFNKNKETGLKQAHIGDKLLYEATV